MPPKDSTNINDLLDAQVIQQSPYVVGNCA